MRWGSSSKLPRSPESKATLWVDPMALRRVSSSFS
jgi:hypothetical protein